MSEEATPDNTEQPEPSPGAADKGLRQKLHLQGWRLWALVAVVVYTLVGFFVVPWVARSQAPKMAKELLGLDLSIERIRVNPYLLSVSVEGLKAADPETGPVLEFDRLFVDFEVSSLWKRAWTFREIRLEGPHASLIRFADGGTNIEAILDRLPESPEPAADSGGPPPRVILSNVSLADGRADLVDRTRPTPWKLSLGPVSFSLAGFGTLTGQEGKYDLEVVTERGGRMTWNGSIAVAPFRSHGSLGLRNIDVVTLWSYVSHEFDADVNEATFNVSFNYDVDASGRDVALKFSTGNIDLSDLAVTRRSTGDELLKLSQASASGIDFDLQAMTLGIGAVEILDPDAHVRRLADGTIDFAAAFTPAGPESPADAAPDEASDTDAASTGANSADTESASPGEASADSDAGPDGAASGGTDAQANEETPAASGSEAARTDEASPPAADGDNPGNVEASDPDGMATVQPPADEDAEPAALAVTFGALNLRGGKIGFEDRAAPRPVQLDLQDLSVDASDYSNAKGHPTRIQLSASLASGGSLQASGEIAPDPLNVALDVEATDVSLLPVVPYTDGAVNLVIDSIDVGAKGRVTINSKQPLGFEGHAYARNFASHLPDEDVQLIAWKRLDAERVKVSLADNSIRVGQATLGQPFLRVRVSENRDLNLMRIVPESRGEKDSGESGSTSGSAAPMAIGVGEVELIQGQMDFRDLSLPLPFQAKVNSMKGSVSAITSGSPTPARVAIDGNVNDYGAATIRGTLDLFDPVRLMDLGIDFRNIEMPDLTPYTVKFAGRKIAGGQLDVDLSWKIRNAELNAENRMVIQDLKLGEKVEAKGAMDLPLDLAVALLSDSQGRIDLAVPVTGDLDNPQFSYTSLVFKALGNILARIVTAPFKLLASLVGGDGATDEQLAFVGFVAGDAQLLGPEQEDLNKLATALDQRPELALSIGAAYDPQRDARAIKESRLDEKVSAQFEVAQAADDDRDPVRAVLEDMYTKSAGADALAALAQEYTKVPEGQDKPVLDESGYLEALRGKLIDAEQVSTQDLQALATERAKAVKSYLVTTTKTDESRLSIADPGEAPKADDNLVYLGLDVTVK